MINLTVISQVIVIITSLLQVLTAYDGHPDITSSPRQVNTKYGTLRGVIIPLSRDPSSTPGVGPQRPSSTTVSPSLSSVEAFFGIPYASPPINTLRFMPPVTPSHWRGVRLANRYGPVCPQRLPDIGNVTEALKIMSSARIDFIKRVEKFIKNNQSEDCLYLNVFVPFHSTTSSTSGSTSTSTSSTSSSSSVKYPVLVFIGGESYDWDAGNAYDGSILSSFGQVIVVTLNYRLGVLGFLPAVVDGAVRGNYGLMDQVAALHWVQENIGELSGDTHNVTVIGHGYGAACVHLLMISPMARGLFARVVLMSGSALSPSAIARDSDTYARHLAKAINCPNFDNVVMVDCLRQKSVDEILRVDLMAPQYLTAFGPIIDGIVVPSEPKQLMQSRTSDSSHSFAMNNMGSTQNYDLLFGVTRVEAPFIFSANEERHGIDLSRRERILRTLVRNLFDYHQQAILLTLINEYTDWNRPIEHPINLLDSTADILGDALVVAPIIETGDLHSKWTLSHHTSHSTSHSTSTSFDPRIQKSFLYVFVYQSEDGNKLLHQRLGCMHGEELAYLFGAPLAVQLLGRSIGHFGSNYSKPEVTLSEAVMNYWINFAKFGDPNVGHNEYDAHQQTNDRSKGRFDSVVWPQYDSIQRKYLMIGMKPKVRDHYHSHRLSFWLHLIPRLHKPGDEDVYLRHHLLQDHENPSTYDGIVRQIAFKFLQPLPTPPFQVGMSPIPGTKRFTTMSTLMNGINNDNSVLNHESIGGITVIDDSLTNKTTATALSVMNESGYATALSVTIAIGCSLLILNMLIFAGVYYQLDRNSKSRADTHNGGISEASGHNHHHVHHHNLNDGSIPEEATLMLSGSHTKSSSRQSISTSSASPISTVLTTNLNQNEYIQHHNNTNSLRRVQTFGKMAKLSLESVPEQTICSVPSQQCSMDYGISDCLQEVEMNHIRVPVCIESNQIKI